MDDDISEEIKTRRINEIVSLQTGISLKKNLNEVGRSLQVLVEGESKKSSAKWQGKTDGNKMVIFPKEDFNVGDYLLVDIHRANSATLFGTAVSSSQFTDVEQFEELAA